MKNIYETVLANVKREIGPPDIESQARENELFSRVESIWEIGDDFVEVYRMTSSEVLNAPWPHSVYFSVVNKAEYSKSNR